MAPKSTIHEEYFCCLCATWACLRKGFQGFRGIRRWKKIKKRESPKIGNHRNQKGVVWLEIRAWCTWCQAQADDGQLQLADRTLFLHQQEFLLRVGVCWGTIMDISFKWILSNKVVADFFQRCHKNLRRQTPKTPACTRLWTARVDLAKPTSFHASTLSPLI